MEQLQAASQHKLTLVSAPPGYGKTTLVAQLARRTNHTVTWHTVEKRDRDVVTLHRRTLEALNNITPGISGALPPPKDYPIPELVVHIVDYLRSVLSCDVLHVLDDVQLLSGSPLAEEWLRTLVELLPPSWHLILISREVPSLPFVEMVARREVLVLGQEHLRMTKQEVYDLAQDTLRVDLSMADAQRLVDRLEGWPAGIVLALQPLPADLGEAMLGGDGTPEALFNTLAASMLRAQSPGLRDFLLTSSTLARMTPESCSVLGMHGAPRWLELAETHNLFLSRVAGGMAYHSLFRDFLQRQLKEASLERFVDLHARAAQWLEEQDAFEEAFEHYLIAGQSTRAAELADRVASFLAGQGQFETLLEWHHRLNEAGVRASRLAFECAMIYLDRFEPDSAEQALAKAREEGADKLCLLSAMIDLQKGDYHKSVEKARGLIEHENPILKGRALRVLGKSYLCLDEPETSINYLEEALAFHRASGDILSLSHLLEDLQLAHWRLGNIEQSGAFVQEAVALRRELQAQGALAQALNNLACHFYDTNHYEEARATFEEGLSIVAHVPHIRAECYLSWSAGNLKRDLGHFSEALTLYSRVLTRLSDRSAPTLQSGVLISISTAWRWQDNTAQAIMLAEEALAIADMHDLTYEHNLAKAALWSSRAQLEPQEALNNLRVIAGTLENAKLKLLGVLGVCADVSLRLSDSSSAETFLESALCVARQLKTAQPFVAEVVNSASLDLETRITSTAKYDLLARDLRLLQNARAARAVTGINFETLISSVNSFRILTLGQEVILRNGKPIPISAWRGAKSRELFLTLLFTGGNTRESINLMFWPDSDEQRQRNNFHATLYPARQALGRDVIIYESGFYKINPDVGIWCDALEFDRLVQQASLLSPVDALAEHLWQKAVDLCRGEFIPSADLDWVIAYRQDLERTYVKALIGLAECARARDDPQRALEHLLRAVDIDVYQEEIHRMILRCLLADVKDRKRAMDYYERLESLFKVDLGIELSQETHKLVRELL